MAATIALRVTGLKAEVDEQQLRAAFAVHGYVQDVSFSDEDGERVATVRYATRSALEAVGDAIAGFSKSDNHPYASTSVGLKVTIAPDKETPPESAPQTQPAPQAQPAPTQPPPQLQPPPAQQPAQQAPPPVYQPPPQQPQYAGMPTPYANAGSSAHPGMMASGMTYDPNMCVHIRHLTRGIISTHMSIASPHPPRGPGQARTPRRMRRTHPLLSLGLPQMAGIGRRSSRRPITGCMRCSRRWRRRRRSSELRGSRTSTATR